MPVLAPPKRISEWGYCLATAEKKLKGETNMEFYEGGSFYETQKTEIRGGKGYNVIATLSSFKTDDEKILGSISLTQEGYKKVLKTAKKKMEKELEKLRKKNEEENIKSDFHMTHEIATISGEIKGILMIYEALEEVLND